MKKIGLIGGLSWHSTIDYYRIINEEISKKYGGLHSAEIVLWSFDFQAIADLQAQAAWEDATRKMVEAGLALKAAGADMLAICTNTMHKMAPDVEDICGLPLLHIVDATAEEIRRQNLKKVALLATRFTMEHDFYRGRLAEKHGITAIVPDSKGREAVHKVIFDDLCQGSVCPHARQHFIDIIDDLAAQGAEGVILGCTEIGLLVKQDDVPIPVFDTTPIHARAIAAAAMEQE